MSAGANHGWPLGTRPPSAQDAELRAALKSSTVLLQSVALTDLDELAKKRAAAQVAINQRLLATRA